MSSVSQERLTHHCAPDLPAVDIVLHEGNKATQGRLEIKHLAVKAFDYCFVAGIAHLVSPRSAELS
jgi:hypothetical protein